MSDTESCSYEYYSSDEDVGICGAPILFDIKCTLSSSTPGSCIFHTDFNVDHSKRWEGRCGSVSLRTGQLCRIKTVTRGTCKHHNNYKPRRPISKASSGFMLDWSGSEYIELRKGPYGQCKGKAANGTRCDNSIYSESDRYCYSHYCQQKRRLNISHREESPQPKKRQKPLQSPTTTSPMLKMTPSRLNVQQSATLRSSSSSPPSSSPPMTTTSFSNQDAIDEEIDFLNSIEVKLRDSIEMKKKNAILLSEVKELKTQIAKLESDLEKAKEDTKRRGSQLVDVVRAKQQQNIEMDMLRSKITKYKQITAMISESL